MSALQPQLGFRGRLVVAMVVLVALVSLTIGALFTAYLFDEEKNRAAAQLDVGERLTEEVMSRRTALELSRLTVLVQDFGFRSAVASGNDATMLSALENHSQRVGAAFAVILDQSRQPLASTLSHEPPVIQEDSYRAAIAQGYGRQLITVNQKGYELLLIPVQAPGLRAWMAAGFALDDAVAEAIAGLSDTEVFFRTLTEGQRPHQIIAASSGVDPAPPEAQADPNGNDTPLDDPRFFSRVVPLDIGGYMQAVLLINRDASLQRFYQRVTEVLLLVVAILLIAIVVALYIARSLGKPVLQLADYARAVGKDNPPAPPELSGGTEITQLGQAFTDMLSRLQEREEQLRYTASHDDVTALGNRNALIDLTKELFGTQTPCSVIGVRLDELSEINDTLGLELGDKVLIGTARRLRESLPDAHLLARTGGDEFLAVLPAMVPEQLDDRASMLAETLRKPLRVDNSPFSLKITVVTLSLPTDASDSNEFRRRLNLTFEKAQSNQPAITRYQSGEDENHLRELKLIADLHKAITDQGLIMNYQPKLDFRTGKLVQVEALVRWIHPELGFISPEEFIFLAERSGQIHDLTAHILDLVATDARAWQQAGMTFGVAINLSAMDLAWAGLPDHIATCFKDLPGGMEDITLEVTESAVMEEPGKAVTTLNQLRALGAKLSVDDFGTGYSSLSQLRSLPVQELKIDKSFVLNLASEPQDQLIVKSTIEMAHGLGLSVVAEGIESMDAWALLQTWQCDLGQGFGLSKPVPASNLARVANELASRQLELAHPDAKSLS
ncbi:putative bifunctional diguanylate cyclase/phosphodiesterase [Marinobacter halophilus]|uniref:Diguanylate phosphodiesterase n=1 Tax=Marinobacter halophilus TaxID=1323740 RepID=A0A2T1KK90_9GAMM|nr:EAL domain-containing protein [Marinobacter halophilus]PSF10022.1 diguanylate phosphodiesterase [Marinobacter halophilus]GGC67043.1 phosphodiesterase [Marinobacter halophilus]